MSDPASTVKFIEDLKVPSPFGANVSEFVDSKKKPMNSFMTYRRSIVKKMNSNGLVYEMKELSKLVSKKWRAEPDAVKEVFKNYSQDVATCSNYSFASKARNQKWIYYEDSKFKRKPYTYRGKIKTQKSKIELISEKLIANTNESIEKNPPSNEFANVDPNKSPEVPPPIEPLSEQFTMPHSKQTIETLAFAYHDNDANTTEQLKIQKQSNCASKYISYNEIISYSTFENCDYNGNLTNLEFIPSVEDAYFVGFTYQDLNLNDDYRTYF
ncbi:10631_t:CDS:1 [Ambispora gerdemannii]|uniref:10631_t:CDS:1 n=1 Tax=Ambispora gerdemannii TaxID=144530 RepID=A0A9N9EA38_9GLOM|nr:10631_t:CDS:1 [Ambispora gerdemannii]